MAEQEIRKELTDILGKACIMFDLRKILQKGGVPKNVPLMVGFKYKDKVLETNKIPPRTRNNDTSEIAKVDITEEITDFLSKTEIQYNFIEVLNKAGFNFPEGQTELTIEFKYGENFEKNIQLTVGICCPCWPGFPFYCAC